MRPCSGLGGESHIKETRVPKQTIVQALAEAVLADTAGVLVCEDVRHPPHAGYDRRTRCVAANLHGVKGIFVKSETLFLLQFFL